MILFNNFSGDGDALITVHKINEVRQPLERDLLGSDFRVNAKVLFAEDNLTNQIVTGSILKKIGCTVHKAENGKEALDMCQTDSYDLILMDCQMPVMDGFEATRQIRSREKKNRVPIIALTASVMMEAKERCLGVGMDDFIVKPFKSHQLKLKLAEYCPDKCISVPTCFSEKIKILLLFFDRKIYKNIVSNIQTNFFESKILIAEDEMDACTLLGSYNPEILIVDFESDQTCNLKFIQFMKRSPRYETVKIIVISSLLEGDKKLKCVSEIGITEVVHKPVVENKLIDAMVRQLTETAFTLSKNDIKKTDKTESCSTSSLKKSEKVIDENESYFSEESISDVSVFNKQLALDLLGGDEEILFKAVEVFLRDAPKMMVDLEKSFIEKDIELAGSYLHKLRGSSSTIAGEQVAGIAKEMEDMCINNDFDNAIVHLKEIAEALRLLLEELKNIKQ